MWNFIVIPNEGTNLPIKGSIMAFRIVLDIYDFESLDFNSKTVIT